MQIADALSSETTAKTYEIMKSPKVKSSLISVSSDAKYLRDSISVMPTRQRGNLTADSILGDEEFIFDDFVINSKAYRRVFLKQQAQLQLHELDEGSPEEEAGSTPEITITNIFSDSPGKSFGSAWELWC